MKVCAVFDIGKTNKKLLLFNEDYQIVKEEQSQFEEVLDDDGFPCDDLIQLSSWLKKTLESIKQNSDYEVVGLNFSAYGATLVHLNSEGKPLTPLYNYLKPFTRQMSKAFTDKYSSGVFTETASPELGMLNSGLQLYWLKESKPSIFHQIKYSLHLPQYCSYLFTKQPLSEITSVGCHTAIWDFQKKDYHTWLESEHIHSIQQKPSVSNVATNIEGIAVGVGIHDSSSALVPYLKSFDERFILLSTGTWAISLNPFNDEPLTDAELQKDCLCYLNYQGNPVKAARLFAGNEHERQTKHLAEYFGKEIDYYKQVKYDHEMVWFLRNKFKQATPETVDVGLLKDCPFVERNLNLFKSYEEAYHQFMLDLVAQQVASLNSVMGWSKPKQIYVDGGFSNNEIYMNLLAESYANKQIFASEIAQASALGAALVIHEHWNSKPIPQQLIHLKRYFC
ncbi:MULTISPECIES: FGGY-family carbohydrate kinase [Emticicia]|uniref:FGGY-family carbohydrate kinase n=1 Tax=Emticicia TaxID=312278 RepID=UPI0007D8BEE9|nr:MULTISPECIES: FGGY family carbohydrate kinase [Emticicia]